MTAKQHIMAPENGHISSREALELEQKLLANSKKYQELKKAGNPMKPVGISIAVTGRCNSHCIMCNIWRLWKENPDMINNEMTKNEILGYLRDPYLSDLVEIDLTGGEPHLREDLVDIIFGIVDLKQTTLKNLKTIIVPSNGFLTDKILPRMECILTRLKGTGIDFVSVSSVDGIGKTHDIMRGTKGAFDKVSKTIDGFMELRKRYAGFFLPGLKTTITHYNVDELDELLNFAVKRNMFYIISSVIISKKRFRNEQYRDKLELDPEDLKKIALFYENRKMDMDFYYQKIFETITTGKRQWTCTALFNYLFIDYDRKVYPCPIQDVCVGDLTKETMTEILTSKRAADVRKAVGTYSLCRQCTEPGTVRYSQVMEGKAMLDFLKSKGREYYQEMIFDKGLHKLLHINI